MTRLSARWAPLLAVLGPGLLAGLSDDDPAGITTYSVLGADHGYQLLWVLLLSTAALVVFHSLAARMGVVTGQGLVGLVRQRYGVRVGGAVLAALPVLAQRGPNSGPVARYDMRAGTLSGFAAMGGGGAMSAPASVMGVSSWLRSTRRNSSRS